jgi:hypothetical protein
MEFVAFGNGHNLSIPLELRKLKKLQMLVHYVVEEIIFSSGNLGTIMEGEHANVVVEDQQRMSSIEHKVSSIENEIFCFIDDKEDDVGHIDLCHDDEATSKD